MQIESPEEKEDGPWGLIIIGLLMLGGAVWLHSVFTDMERSGGSMRIQWMFALLYRALGKWGVVSVIGLIGGGLLWSGLRKLGKD